MNPTHEHNLGSVRTVQGSFSLPRTARNENFPLCLCYKSGTGYYLIRLSVLKPKMADPKF